MKRITSLSTAIAPLIISLLIGCSKEIINKDPNTQASPAAAEVSQIDTLQLTIDKWISEGQGVYQAFVDVPQQFATEFPESKIIAVYVNITGDYEKIGENPVDYMGGTIWYKNYFDTGHVLFFKASDSSIPFDSVDCKILLSVSQT